MPQNEHENSNNDGHLNNSQNYSILQVSYFIFVKLKINDSIYCYVIKYYSLQMLNNAQGPQNYMINQGQNPVGLYFRLVTLN